MAVVLRGVGGGRSTGGASVEAWRIGLDAAGVSPPDGDGTGSAPGAAALGMDPDGEEGDVVVGVVG